MTVVINGTTGIDKVQATATAGQVIQVNGVTFPATQVPSADANTLDDFEEGTFTPTLTFQGNSVGMTYASGGRQGSYVKVGQLVFFNIYIQLTAKGSSTGSVWITGMPFPYNGSVNNATYISPASLYNVSSGPIGLFGGVLSSNCYIYYSGASGYSNLSDGVFTNTTQLQVTGCYQASA